MSPRFSGLSTGLDPRSASSSMWLTRGLDSPQLLVNHYRCLAVRWCPFWRTLRYARTVEGLGVLFCPQKAFVRKTIRRASVENMVRVRGLEPLLLSEPDPKSGASANFATRATVWENVLQSTRAQALIFIELPRRSTATR